MSIGLNSKREIEIAEEKRVMMEMMSSSILSIEQTIREAEEAKKNVQNNILHLYNSLSLADLVRMDFEKLAQVIRCLERSKLNSVIEHEEKGTHKDNELKFMLMNLICRQPHFFGEVLGKNAILGKPLDILVVENAPHPDNFKLIYDVHVLMFDISCKKGKDIGTVSLVGILKKYYQKDNTEKILGSEKSMHMTTMRVFNFGITDLEWKERGQFLLTEMTDVPSCYKNKIHKKILEVMK